MRATKNDLWLDHPDLNHYKFIIRKISPMTSIHLFFFFFFSFLFLQSFCLNTSQKLLQPSLLTSPQCCGRAGGYFFLAWCDSSTMLTSLVPSIFFLSYGFLLYVSFIIFVAVFVIVGLFFRHDLLVFCFYFFCLLVGMLKQIQVHFIPDNGTVVHCTVISVACMLTSMTLLFLQTSMISFSALRLWCPK